MTYTYGPTNNGPHQARNVGGQTYTYDANGNLISGGNRTYTWNADNLPGTVTNGGVTESYTYDADGERVAKTVGGTTTIYFQGIWEQIVGGASMRYYTFSDQVVAMRDSSGVTYLHGDHLGSVSLATNSSGAVVSRQDFDPWGKARGTSAIGQTSLNYTGQRLDGTGLLYYHARYYDPALARFVSADTIVPGSASGGMDGVALKGLTVDFHEPGFVAQIAGENGQAFWFQLSDDERGKVGSPWGPSNPQALNRYSYVQNNPLRWTDPSGHAAPLPKCWICGYQWADISHWFTPVKYVVAAGCAVLGCHVDIDKGTVSGPTYQEWAEASVASLMPTGGVIKGFTKHALNQAISRDGVGVSTRAILDAVENPLKVEIQKSGTIKYVGQNATVILNDAGEVVTTWARNRLGWRINP